MTPVIREILNAPGVDLGAKDKRGWTALEYAKCGKHQRVIEMIELAGEEWSGRIKEVGCWMCYRDVVHMYEDRSDNLFGNSNN